MTSAPAVSRFRFLIHISTSIRTPKQPIQRILLLLKGDIVISARSGSAKSDVGELLQQAVGEAGSAGGHATMAAGQVPAGELSSEACLALRVRIIADFVRLAGKEVQESELLFERPGDAGP